MTRLLQREAVRLVIWDLDETFWNGTLCEGGIAWNEGNAATVKRLALRGIVSAICSKNEPGAVEALLREHGLDEHFVFSSVSWEPKGPRLKALVDAVQLRPETILFIDDNPQNRAEAAHYVAGLQVGDETIVPGLLDDPRLAGRPDPQGKRLAQYRLLERRHADQRQGGGDTTAFLRESGITVEIEYDLAPHLDRAVELINRTNQLNFTKRRLPEEPEAARGALRTLLARFSTQAGLLRVRDRYGDHGYCGLYVLTTERRDGQTGLVHFAFSCRILGMGIESWLYRRLKRPVLDVAGPVLGDPVSDNRVIDWITPFTPVPASRSGTSPDGPAGKAERGLSYVLARGGCDMRAIAHYFEAVAERVVEETACVRDGKARLNTSSVIAAHAIRGVPPALLRDARAMHFMPEDFTTLIAYPPGEPNAVWLLSFALECPVPVLRHKETGALLPAWFPAARGKAVLMLENDPGDTGLDPALVAHMRAHFTMVGLLPDDIFRDNLRLILGQAPAGTPVFILLANEQGRRPDGSPKALKLMRERNRSIRDATREIRNVTLIEPADIMSSAELAALDEPHHYDRVVYFRIFQHIMSRIPPPATTPAAPPAAAPPA